MHLQSKIGDRELVKKLVGLLRRPLLNVRECLRFLVRVDPETFTSFLRRLKFPSFYLPLFLARLTSIVGSRSFTLQLVDLMKDADPSLRLIAIVILGEVGDSKLAPYFVEALEDPSIEVRLEAVNALKRLRNESGLHGLVKALRNSDPIVRVAAVRSLELFRKEDVLPHLITALKDESVDVVYASLKTIREMGLHEAIIHVIPLLNSGEPEIRAEAKRVLESFARRFGFSGNEGEWIELSVNVFNALEDFRRRLKELESALESGDMKTADKCLVELDEFAEELKFQIVKTGGWGLNIFEKEEEKLEELAKELDLMGAERAKALQNLSGVLRELLELKGVVSLEDVPKASFKGRPVIRDEDIVSVFEEMVREGFRGVMDGNRLVSLDFVRKRISELAKVYSRIRTESIAEKVGVSERLLVKMLEELFASGSLQGKIDDANKIVEFQTSSVKRDDHSSMDVVGSTVSGTITRI
ncbi:MAG: HEAT repeat domain-containing protein [Candidatus Jordarchaeales archaeon]